ncbi:hypothetical protein [Virgisporangium ochraceum]|uniref:hypothetical protein n=1 Tax=Virgisporangium ochraceum TaxID=65505 RepID=UPI001944E129|nr:hypothetical protein [Virgisporangium ochraceum]
MPGRVPADVEACRAVRPSVFLAARAMREDPTGGCRAHARTPARADARGTWALLADLAS